MAITIVNILTITKLVFLKELEGAKVRVIIRMSFVVSNTRNALYEIESNAVVTPLRKAASYEQRKTNLGSSP